MACGGSRASRKPSASRPVEHNAISRIAFGSCAHQDHPQPVWDVIRSHRPDLILLLGDNIYGDADEERNTLKTLSAAYATFAGHEGFSRLRREVPMMAIWDDHDYGVNDGAGDFPLRRESEALFREFWGIGPSDVRSTREGLYFARTFGPEGRRVQVIMLDLRSFRSTFQPTDDPGAPGKERYIPYSGPDRTMLGAAQWSWLENAIRQPADVRFLVSSIQVFAEDHGYERWGNLPKERDRLVRLIASSPSPQAVVLSGDRHMGGLYRYEHSSLSRPIIELTSSALNQESPSEPPPVKPPQVSPLYPKPNFGWIEITWPRDPNKDRSIGMALELRAEDGTVVHSLRTQQERRAQ